MPVKQARILKNTIEHNKTAQKSTIAQFYRFMSVGNHSIYQSA
jgi:hypothetical protein